MLVEVCDEKEALEHGPPAPVLAGAAFVNGVKLGELDLRGVYLAGHIVIALVSVWSGLENLRGHES